MRYSRTSPNRPAAAAPPQGGTLGRATRTARASPDPTHEPVGSQGSDSLKGIAQLVKKGFDKLVDGEASSPATATLSSFR